MKELPAMDEKTPQNTLYSPLECSPCRNRRDVASEIKVAIKKIPAELLTHLMSLAGNGRGD